MTTTITQTFADEVNKCLSRAFIKYNITNSIESIEIKFEVIGKCYAKAGYKTVRNVRQYYLNFNLEAIEKYYNIQVADTIPHEVAHIVCYIKPELGIHHNKGWKQVCRALGGSGDRTATNEEPLTSARQKVIRNYKIGDKIVNVGAKRHSKIQQGHLYWCNKILIKPNDYIDEITSKPIVTRTATKKELAMDIYFNNQTATSQQLIQMFMTQLDMTKAGATTYLYNLRNVRKFVRPGTKL